MVWTQNRHTCNHWMPLKPYIYPLSNENMIWGQHLAPHCTHWGAVRRVHSTQLHTVVNNGKSCSALSTPRTNWPVQGIQMHWWQKTNLTSQHSLVKFPLCPPEDMTSHSAFHQLPQTGHDPHTHKYPKQEQTMHEHAHFKQWMTIGTTWEGISRPTPGSRLCQDKMLSESSTSLRFKSK